MFAPHARWRALVTACAGQPITETASATLPPPEPTLPATTRRPASISWARLLARIYENRPLRCPRCQGEMRLIAFLIDPDSIRALLTHLGEPTTPPPLTPRARAPPALEIAWLDTRGFELDQSPPWDPTAAAPDPGHSFDQTLN